MSNRNPSSVVQPEGSRSVRAQAAGTSAATSDTRAPQVLAGKSAAVIGGGPAGVLCAAHLAHLGATVTVFEKHAADAAQSAPGWNIALGRIATKAIAAAGLNPEFPPHLKSEASTLQYVGQPRREPGSSLFVCTTSRAEITAYITAETLRVHGGRVEIRSGVSLVGGAVSRGELELEDAGGGRERRSVDLVVGADGVHSHTRSLLSAQDPSFKADQHGCDVKTLTASVSPLGNPVAYRDLPTPNGQPYDALADSVTEPIVGTVTSFFFPAAKVDNPGVNFLIVNSRRGGEEVTVGITASVDFWDSRPTQAAAREALFRCFPHFPTVWLEECAIAAAEAPAKAPRRSRFVTCSKLGSGRAILIGDAAHAMSANLGMGCNTALLDTAALADAAVAAGGDLDALAEHFTRAHLPDVRAMSNISRGMYDVTFAKEHGGRLRALAGLPMFLWVVAGFLAPSLPGVLRPLFKPKHDRTAMHGGTVPLRELEADARALSTRLAATAAAVLAGAAALLWRLGAAALA